jgi:hypothetical protein
MQSREGQLQAAAGSERVSMVMGDPAVECVGRLGVVVG